jgi:hypothetical protein
VADSPDPTASPDSGYPPVARAESVWPSLLCVLGAIALQLALPTRLLIGPRWLVPGLEAALLGGLAIATPMELERPHRVRRSLALSLTAFVSAANAVSLGLLAHHLLHHNVSDGSELIVSGALIWLTNVLIFGLWYWEVDRGGPGMRALGHDRMPDLLFPQMADDRHSPPGWRPGFIDYLYVSLTNATAFSPTDTMPLTQTAKLMMGLQSLVSVVTLGLVISRAVNIL